MPSDSPAPKSASIPSIWLFALALLPTLALLAWHWSGGPGADATDYAQYILHGRALAAGRHYADIGYIFTPFGAAYAPQVQPPGLPLLLAVLFKIFGTGMLVPRLVLVAAALSYFVMVGVYFSRYTDRLVAVSATLLAGLAAPVITQVSQVQTDLPFCALCWAIILLYDTEQPLGAGRIAAITILGGLAILFRTVGVALIPAALLYAFSRRRTAGFRPAIAPLAWILSAGLAQLIAPSAGGFVTMLKNSMPTSLGYFGFIPSRIFDYRYAPLEATLYPFPTSVADDAYHVIAGILCVAGGWILLRRIRTGYLSWFVLCYAGILAIAPVSVPRYTLPLHPILTAGFLVAIFEAMRRTRFAGRAGTVVLLVAVAIAAGTVRNDLKRQRSLADFPDVRSLFARVRADADTIPAMRVVFARALVLTEQTGVPAMPTFIAPPDSIIAVLKRRCITHVVLGDLDMAVRRGHAVRFAVERHRALFQDEYRNQSFELLRFQNSCINRPELRRAP